MHRHRSRPLRAFFVGALLCMCVVLWPPAGASAQENFTITPVVETLKGKQRDIIKKELRIFNATQSKQNFYAVVTPVDPMSGESEFVAPTNADLATSLSNWIELTRGVIELMPGEEQTIPYLVNINMRALPGIYHAKITFGMGTTRADAEKSIEHAPSMLLSVEVEDDGVQKLELEAFSPLKTLFTGKTADFSFSLENVGNRPVVPKGTIRIFNKKGEEVAILPINENGEAISPESVSNAAAAWAAEGRFGKYKAYLDVEYGDKQRATVNDTVYFWIVPWREILLSLIGVTALAVVGTYIIHLRSLSVARPRFIAPTPEPAPLKRGSAVALSPVKLGAQTRLPDRKTYDTSLEGHVVTLSKR